MVSTRKITEKKKTSVKVTARLLNPRTCTYTSFESEPENKYTKKHTYTHTHT